MLASLRGVTSGLRKTQPSGGDNFYGFYLDNLDIVAAMLALFGLGLVAFSQYTKTGRALRAVADDHQARLSVGISVCDDLGDGLVDCGLCGAWLRVSCGEQNPACNSRFR